MRAEDPKLPEVVPPGPDNPMGTRRCTRLAALRHPWHQQSLGSWPSPSSSGCIRMYPEHVEELFELVEVGTKITVVDQPIKLEWSTAS